MKLELYKSFFHLQVIFLNVHKHDYVEIVNIVFTVKETFQITHQWTFSFYIAHLQ